MVILAIWRYPRYYDTPLRYLPIIVMYTFLTDLLGVLIRDNSEISLMYKELYYNNNWLIFNVYNLLFFIYFFYVYRSFISSKKSKKIIEIGAVLFLITSIINPLAQSFKTMPQLTSYIIGAIVLLWSIYLYAIDLKKDYGVYFLKKDLLSWLSLGMAIFYAGYLPIKILRYYMTIYDFNILWVGKVHHYLILIMYLCFAIGLVIMRRRKLPSLEAETE